MAWSVIWAFATSYSKLSEGKKIMLRRKKDPLSCDKKILLSYYPNRRNLYVIPVFVFVCLFAVIVFLDFLRDGGTYTLESFVRILLPLGTSICGILGILFLFKTAQQRIFCADDGIYVMDSVCAKPCFLAWDDRIYAYSTSNFQGQPYLVLSRKQLTHAEAKKLVNRSGWVLKIITKDAVVIWDNASRKAQQLFAAITEHIQITAY